VIGELKDFRDSTFGHVALNAVAFGLDLAFGLRRILVAIDTGVDVVGPVV
jgi:hypothetical protein